MWVCPPGPEAISVWRLVTMKRKEFVVGLLLGAMTCAMLLATAYHLTHVVQKDARIVGLPIPVQTVPVAVRTLHETIGASGVTQPGMPVEMTAKVVSRVLSVPVDLGAVVKPGTLLVQLDPQLFQANLATARLSYEHAHRQLARIESLAKQNFASAVALEDARTAAAAARQAVIAAEIDLSNCTVRSPAPAVVLNRYINPGEFTQTDQHLIELGVLDPVLMAAQVSEDKSGSVYLGMHAEVGTDAFPGVSFHGNVAKIDFRINDATRTFAVYIELANHDLRLKKGVTGYARLESTRMALAIPSTAVINPLGDRAAVFVVGKDLCAHTRVVQVAAVVDGMTEILRGLSEGDQVVTMGQFGLHEGDRISANRYAPWNSQL